MQTESSTGSLDASMLAAVRDFYDRYFACIEDQDLESWPSFFTEDASYVVKSLENHRLELPIGDVFCDSRAMIRDRAAALRSTSMFEPRQLRHFAGTLRASLAPPDTVRTEAGFMWMESIVGEPPAVFAVGRSLDEIVRIEGELRFRRRLVVYDHTAIRNSLIFPL